MVTNKYSNSTAKLFHCKPNLRHVIKKEAERSYISLVIVNDPNITIN